MDQALTQAEQALEQAKAGDVANKKRELDIKQQECEIKEYEAETDRMRADAELAEAPKRRPLRRRCDAEQWRSTLARAARPCSPVQSHTTRRHDLLSLQRQRQP
jgi:hypothetical protein